MTQVFALQATDWLNLFLYYKLAVHPLTEPFLLAGEGSFHQIHGGVTTSGKGDRDGLLERINNQLEELLGEKFHAPMVEFTILGRFRAPVLRYLKFSVERGMDRFSRMEARGRDPYKDDRRKRKRRGMDIQPG